MGSDIWLALIRQVEALNLRLALRDYVREITRPQVTA